MRKVLFIMLMVCGLVFSEYRVNIITENLKAVSTNASLYSVVENGYLEMFSNAKVYVSLMGSTPDVTYRYISAGGSLDTQGFYYVGDKIGVKSDSGTANMVFTTYR